MSEFLGWYAAIGFVVAGIGVAQVSMDGERVDLFGVPFIVLFWPLVVVAMIASAYRAIK